MVWVDTAFILSHHPATPLPSLQRVGDIGRATPGALCLLCATPQEKGICPVGSFCLLTAKGVREGPISNATLINVSHTVTVMLEQSINSPG